MDILNASMDLFDPAMVVNNIVIILISAIVGIVVAIIVFKYKWKKAEESKKRDKLEQEKNREVERKNIISNLIQSLIPEININQNRLQPLSDCVDKVLDCDNCEYSETEILPKKLHFERTVYSSLLGKIGLLDNDIIAKMIRYYSETKDIEEEYKKLDIIHGNSHGFLFYLIVDHKHKDIPPSTDEIIGFFRHTKKVYDLGSDLIINMENNTGAPKVK